VSKFVVSVRTMASALSSAACRLRNALRCALPALLLALDDDLHVERQTAPPPSATRPPPRVHHDAGLVVRRSTPVEPPVPLRRLERRALPRRLVSPRLYVMVGIQQHVGLPGPSGARRTHRVGPSISSNWTLSKPRARRSVAVASALARTWPRQTPRRTRWECAPAASNPPGSCACGSRNGTGRVRSSCPLPYPTTPGGAVLR
jgi:hypothetical protein